MLEVCVAGNEDKVNRADDEWPLAALMTWLAFLGFLPHGAHEVSMQASFQGGRSSRHATRLGLTDCSGHVHPKLLYLDFHILVCLLRLCQIGDLVFLIEFEFLRSILWPMVGFCNIPFVRVRIVELRFYLHFKAVPFCGICWYTELDL